MKMRGIQACPWI